MLLCCLLGLHSTHVRNQGAAFSHSNRSPGRHGGGGHAPAGRDKSNGELCRSQRLVFHCGPAQDQITTREARCKGKHTPSPMTSRTSSACTAGSNVHAHFIDATLDVSLVPTLSSPGATSASSFGAAATVRTGYAIAHVPSCTRGVWRSRTTDTQRDAQARPITRLGSSCFREGQMTRAGQRAGGRCNWRVLSALAAGGLGAALSVCAPSASALETQAPATSGSSRQTRSIRFETAYLFDYLFVKEAL